MRQVLESLLLLLQQSSPNANYLAILVLIGFLTFCTIKIIKARRGDKSIPEKLIDFAIDAFGDIKKEFKNAHPGVKLNAKIVIVILLAFFVSFLIGIVQIALTKDSGSIIVASVCWFFVFISYFISMTYCRHYM